MYAEICHSSFGTLDGFVNLFPLLVVESLEAMNWKGTSFYGLFFWFVTRLL